MTATLPNLTCRACGKDHDLGGHLAGIILCRDCGESAHAMILWAAKQGKKFWEGAQMITLDSEGLEDAAPDPVHPVIIVDDPKQDAMDPAVRRKVLEMVMADGFLQRVSSSCHVSFSEARFSVAEIFGVKEDEDETADGT